MQGILRLKLIALGFAVFGILGVSCGRPSAYGKVFKTPYPVVDRLGNNREYRLFLPEGTGGPFPLMVYFHGVISPGFKNIPGLKTYTGSPVEETELIPFCRARKVALLVPEARYEYTFLKCLSKGWLTEKELDGVEKIIDTVTDRFAIDRKQIYLAGISAGAVFCHFLANNRPLHYKAIISHSQAYVSERGEVLRPAVKGPQFGIVFCYNIGDYKQLIRFCTESESLYSQEGYRTALLADLPPRGHAWSSVNNARFWKLLRRLGRRE